MGRKRERKSSVVRMAFEKAHAWMDKYQRRIADYLNRKCAHFSTKQLTVGVIGFCLLFGSAIAFTVWNTLESFGVQSKSSAISMPKYILIRDSNTRFTMPRFNSIQKFRVQLDSLKASETGSLFLDSLKKKRPGLFDSLHLVENIYQLKSSENETNEK